ncbi:GNAT family N-acetyltransferase [Roseibium marinum]|uniref:Ribosomal protein S18 acetylase RimI-like enzyme n=1 Tax=Roseibium marinum TaxID=281252 RepID=A0A2S3USF2_9HYPH|nr:N-acetyltransferase [Roseibium marinum]POF30399.1 ribosomal protein S18 acetylase RimI-like enzyme [Roseibium marinum]
MNGITIKRAERDDVERLHGALQLLSKDLGDTHAADRDDLLRHGFCEPPAFFALIATRQTETVGALLASPLFSTTRAGAGLYVSDLWVAENTRGSGLGRRLLAAALEQAPANWTVTFLKLAVYHDNPDASRFYERLGFEPRGGETVFDLRGPALTKLRNSS